VGGDETRDGQRGDVLCSCEDRHGLSERLYEGSDDLPLQTSVPPEDRFEVQVSLNTEKYQNDVDFTDENAQTTYYRIQIRV
jgi:hypothetical protein